MMAPTVDAIATEYLGKLKVRSVDVDQNGGAAMSEREIATLLQFKGGRVGDSAWAPWANPRNQNAEIPRSLIVQAGSGLARNPGRRIGLLMEQNRRREHPACGRNNPVIRDSGRSHP